MSQNFVQRGDRLTIVASKLVAPNSPPKSNDPVVCGRLCGVAEITAAVSTDNVVVQTRGVYNLAVKSIHTALDIGHTVYIDAATGVVSDDYTAVPFGIALGAVAQYATTTIPVKLLGATPGAAGAGS